jgi:hypothetical protein
MAVAPAANQDGYAALCRDSLRFDVHPGARERPEDE